MQYLNSHAELLHDGMHHVSSTFWTVDTDITLEQAKSPSDVWGLHVLADNASSEEPEKSIECLIYQDCRGQKQRIWP